MALNLQLTYYPWITQSITGPALRQAVGAFAELWRLEVSRLLSTPVAITLMPEMEVQDQIAHIRQPPTPHDGTVALMNPLGYAITHGMASEVESIAVVRRRIGDPPAGPTYKAQIYCHMDSEIQDMQGLRKRSFGFGSPQSTSNFLVPANLLLTSGLHPFYSFARLDFAGGHDKVAKAVYERRLDAGAGHDGVIIDLAKKEGYSHALERLRRLTWSEPITSDPVVANIPDKDVKAAVLSGLLTIAPPGAPTTPGNTAVNQFWATPEGFEPISPDSYAVLLAMLPPLQLRASDLIKKWY